MCMLSVSNVIYHTFSHGAAFYKLYGKNINVMLEFLIMSPDPYLYFFFFFFFFFYGGKFQAFSQYFNITWHHCRVGQYGVLHARMTTLQVFIL